MEEVHARSSRILSLSQHPGVEQVDLLAGGGGPGFAVDRVVFGEKNSARLPAYHRLDLVSRNRNQLYKSALRRPERKATTRTHIEHMQRGATQ